MSTSPADRNRSSRLLLLAGAALFVLGTVYWIFGSELRVYRELSAARTELTQDQVGRALERLERLDRAEPNRRDVIFWSGVAHRRAEHLTQAEELFTRAETLGYDSEAIVLQRALAACRAGGVNEVEPLLRDALRRGVDDDTAADVYDALASGYIVAYRLKDAWQCLDFWISWQPQAVKPRLLRAAICLQLRDRETALEDFLTVLAAQPQHEEARLKSAQTLQALNRSGEALEAFRRGAREHPDNLEFRLGEAICLQGQGQFDEAQATLDGLLKERLPASLRPKVLQAAGDVALDRGDAEQAIALLRSAEKLTPREPIVHRALFRAYSLAGKRDLAQEHRQTYDRMSKDKERLQEVTSRLAEEPQRVDLRYEAGTLLARNEFLDDAIGWWQSGLRIDPRHRRTHLALAEAYGAKGDRARAAHHRQAAEQLKEEAESSTSDPTTPSRERSTNDSKPAEEVADGPPK